MSIKKHIEITSLLDALNHAASRGDVLGLEIIYSRLKNMLGDDEILIKEYKRHSRSSEDKPTDRLE